MNDENDAPNGRDGMIRAALSTYSQPLALGDDANKVLFEAYTESPASVPAARWDLEQLAPGNQVRSQLLKLANDLPFLANAKSKPESVVLAKANIEESVGQGEVSSFTRITAEELALGKFDLTYLIDGVLVKDQPTGLVASKKSLKTNISVDLAIALATGGRFLGYFRVAEPKRMAVFYGESGMATIQETALRVSKAAGVSPQETGIIFSDTVPHFGDPLNMEAFRRFLEAAGIEVVIIDQVYLCLPCDINPAKLFDIGGACGPSATSARRWRPCRSWCTT